MRLSGLFPRSKNQQALKKTLLILCLVAALITAIAIAARIRPGIGVTTAITSHLHNGGGTAQKTTDSSPAELLAHRHSFGLLTETNADWEAIRQRTISKSWYGNPDNPLENVTNAAYWNQHNMNPTFDCPQAEKVGGSESGETKYVCNPKRLAYPGKEGGCLIYSFGCAGDFKFEDAIHKMHGVNCEVHIFDPAKAWERPGDAENKNIHYHAWGLVSTYDATKSVVWPKGRGGAFKTFPEIIDILGHRNRTIDVLKIDCEGCEWSTHKDWIHLGIRQILIEVHGVPSPHGTPTARWYQRPLNLSEYYQSYIVNGYALFNKDPNGALSLELCFIKLQNDFFLRPSQPGLRTQVLKYWPIYG